MKQKVVLPAFRLCLSERLFIIGIASFILGMSGAMVMVCVESPWMILGVAVLLRIIASDRRRRQHREGGIHGDAHFATEEEVAAAGLIGGGPGMVIGKLADTTRYSDPLISLKIVTTGWRRVGRLRFLLDRLVMPARSKDGWAFRSLVRVPESERAAHLGFFLPTGIGKTHRVLVPSLYLCPENAFVFDPSGETVQAVAEFRRKEFGHEYRVIDPFRVSGVAESDRINVFDLVAPGDPRAFDFCNYLGHALIVEKPESQREPFWPAATVHATVFQLLSIALNDNMPLRNLLTLGELLNGERLQKLAKALAEHPNPALRRRAEQILNYKGKTLDSLLACLTTEHSWLDAPAYENVLTDSTFRLRDMLTKPMDLYVCVPGHRAKESQPFIRMLLTAMLYVAFEAGPDIRRPPVRLYLDEIATLGQLELLMTLYTQGRKYGLRSASFFQSAGQVAEITGSPEKVQTVRSQFSVELFKAADYQTAREVSDWIGSRTAQTVSTSQQWSRNHGWSTSSGASYSSGRSGGWSESVSTTYGETGVPAIRPEQVLQMSHSEAILMKLGTPPVRVSILDADDVRRCADPRPALRYQRKYLWRVRILALLFLLAGIASLTIIGVVGVKQARRWAQRQNQVQPVQQGPATSYGWQAPYEYPTDPNRRNRRVPVWQRKAW